jgi:hypothetical protein
MEILTIVLLSITLILTIVILIKLQPEKLREGDIVIVRDPHCEPEMMNMVTIVLNVLSLSTVQVRGIKTTVVLNRKWVRRIDTTNGSSIKVPMKPVITRTSPGNQAEFQEVPLSWFKYTDFTLSELE